MNTMDMDGSGIPIPLPDSIKIEGYTQVQDGIIADGESTRGFHPLVRHVSRGRRPCGRVDKVFDRPLKKAAVSSLKSERATGLLRCVKDYEKTCGNHEKFSGAAMSDLGKRESLFESLFRGSEIGLFLLFSVNNVDDASRL